MRVPHEINIGEIYVPPLLIAAFLGVIATAIAMKFLNKYRLSNYFFYPPIVMLALAVIFTLLFGMLIIPF